MSCAIVDLIRNADNDQIKLADDTMIVRYRVRSLTSIYAGAFPDVLSVSASLAIKELYTCLADRLRVKAQSPE
jgi:hypothetical protein